MMKKRSTTYRLNKVDYSIFIICSIAAAAMFFLFYRDLNSFTIKQTEEPIAKIYFKRNTAQRKFLDSDVWEVLANSSNVYDGDRIRTSTDSEAYTEFSDTQIQIQLNEKSMIQIFKSKDKKDVNFIGGEIRVANKSGSDDSLTIHSGNKDISILGSSEAKLSLPDISDAAAAGEEEAGDSAVVVEVVSGRVEVKNQDDKKNSDTESVLVKAGEALKFGSGRSAPEKIATVQEIEAELAAQKEAEERAAQEEAKRLLELEEAAKKEAEELAAKAEAARKEAEQLAKKKAAQRKAAQQAATKKRAQQAAAKKKAAEENAAKKKSESTVTTVAKEKPTVQAEPKGPKLPTEVAASGVEKTLTRKSINLLHHDFIDEKTKAQKYNYEYYFCIAELTDKFKIIPKGSILQLEINGTANRNIAYLAIQIGTGEEPWQRAHAFTRTSPNDGAGVIKDVPFTIKKNILIDKDIVNTDTAYMGIAYDPEVLDEPVNMSDFKISVNLVSPSATSDTKEAKKGLTKTFEYKSVLLRPNTTDYILPIAADSIFGENASIPKGKKIRVTVSGTSDTPIKFMFAKLIDNKNDDWDVVWLRNNDYSALGFSQNPIPANKAFSYKHTYKLSRPVTNTYYSMFELVVPKDQVPSAPTFTDLKITIELL
ncbi:MAG: FecR domain-containing protein [Treponema sp.]|nr:FecR domain-containing protein [Treponema sp.]